MKEEIAKKRPQMKKKKSALSPRQCTVSQVDRNNGKIARIALWIASPSTVSSGSGSNEEVIAETEAYFESNDKSFY